MFYNGYRVWNRFLTDKNNKMKIDYDKDFKKVMTELQTNFGWGNIEVLPDSYRDLLNDTIKAVKNCSIHNVGNSLPYPVEILDGLKVDVEFSKGRLVIKKQ